MGMKRNIDSGRVDSLGRPIKVSGNKGDISSDSKMSQITDYGDVDGQWDIDSMDYDDAVDIVKGHEDAPDEVISELKRMRSEYIDNLSTDDLTTIVSDCNGWDGSLEEYQLYEVDSGELEIICGGDFEKFANMIHFGNYNPFHEYFTLDGYGNIKTYSESDYHGELDRDREEIYERYEELMEESPQYISDDYKWI